MLSHQFQEVAFLPYLQQLTIKQMFFIDCLLYALSEMYSSKLQYSCYPFSSVTTFKGPGNVTTLIKKDIYGPSTAPVGLSVCILTFFVLHNYSTYWVNTEKLTCFLGYRIKSSALLIFKLKCFNLSIKGELTVDVKF